MYKCSVCVIVISRFVRCTNVFLTTSLHFTFAKSLNLLKMNVINRK